MHHVLLRADSSSKIGLGHIMRDLVLCQQFADSKITFATKKLKGNINHKILEAGHKVENLQSNAKEELLKLIKALKIDLLIIDHYSIDAKYEKYLKKHSKVKIFSLDDTYEKHHCDILLNHNIGADEKRYKKLVPSFCELRCGSHYSLIRDEFYKQKNKMKKSEKNTTIFIAMGGTDEKNLSKSILNTLKNVKNIEVNIVTSSSNKNLFTLKKYIKPKKWIHLHINSTKIAKLMAKSDFAIVTPSVILNEVFFMKLPFIAIKTAKNQSEIYTYLKQNSFEVLKKFNMKKLKQKLRIMM